MAENDVRVVGIDDRAKQTLNDFGWATEATLAKLANNSQISLKLLQKIAKSKGASESAVTGMQKGDDQKSSTVSFRKLDNATDNLSKGIFDISKNTNRNAEHAINQIGKLGAIGTNKIGDAFRKTTSLLGTIAGPIKGIFTGPEKKFDQVIQEIGSGIKGFAQSFQPSGILGKVVKGAIGIFGSLVSVVGLGVEKLREMNTMVRTLYTAGIRPEGGFKALASTAISTGLSMQELTKIITNFGGVAVTLGTKRMMTLQSQIARQTRLGADFMMSQQELQEAVLDSMEMMRVSNELATSSNAEIEARSTRTIHMLNELSQATGKNRDELRKATLELMKSTKQFGLMRSAGKGSGEAIQGLMASLTAEFGSSAGQLAEMVEGMFMGGPALVDEAMRPLLAIVPGFSKELEDVTQGIKSGTLDPKQAAIKISDIIENIDESSLRTLRAANPALYQTIRQMQLNNQQARASREKDAQLTAEQQEAREKELEREKKRQATFNELDATMNALKVSFNTFLATAVEPLMPIIKKLADIIGQLTMKFANAMAKFFEDIDWEAKTDSIQKWIDSLSTDKIVSFIQSIVDAGSSILNFISRVKEFLGIDTTTAIILGLITTSVGGWLLKTLTNAGVMAIMAKLMSNFGGNLGKDPGNAMWVRDVNGGPGGQQGARGPSGQGQSPGGPGRQGGPGGPRTPGGGRFSRLFGTAMTAMSFYQMMEGFMQQGGTPAQPPVGAPETGQQPAAPGTEQPMSGGAADQSLLAKTTEMISGNAGLIAGAVDMLSGLAPVANLGGIAGKAANLLKSPGALVASIAGSMATDALKEAGYEKTGAAADIATNALSWGSTGAMLGSFVPGLGTLVGGGLGAAAGGAYSLYKNWDTLFGAKPTAMPPAVGPQAGPPPIDIREIERTVGPLQDTTVKDLNEEFADSNEQNQQAMNKLLDALASQMEVQRETNRRLEDGFRRMSAAIEDASPRM